MESFNFDKQAAEAYIRASVFDAMRHFKDETLGTQIDLQLISEPIKEGVDQHWSGVRTSANGKGLDLFAKFLTDRNSSLLNKATHVLFTGDDKDNIHVIANQNTVCKPFNHPFNQGEHYIPSMAIVEKNNENETIGWLLAHELGHNLGMQHGWEWEDKHKYVPKGYCTKEETGSVNFLNNLQHYGQYTWTICNRCDLLRSYQYHILNFGKYCLENLNEINEGDVKEN